ncbi:MAG: DinB family protein [Undibacterium sp.]|nr:DinB family protein [Undibacterium sp.]
MSIKILQSLFAQKSWANMKLFPVVASMSALEASSQQNTIIEILHHVYIVDRIFRAHLLGHEHEYTTTNTKPTPDLTVLQNAVAENDDWFEKYLASISESSLAQEISFHFTDGDRGTMTREEMLFHLITHGAWHRGEVGQILESILIPSPPDSLTKFLHATEPERRRLAL